MNEASQDLLGSKHSTRRLVAIVLGASVLTLGLALSITSGLPAEAAEHILFWCGIG